MKTKPQFFTQTDWDKIRTTACRDCLIHMIILITIVCCSGIYLTLKYAAEIDQKIEVETQHLVRMDKNSLNDESVGSVRGKSNSVHGL